MAESIAIASLRRDGGTQPRAALDAATVESYAEALREGVRFPPVGVVHDGTDHWVWDGFHRIAGHEAAGLDRIEATITAGTRRDAVLLACGANAAHGLRRTVDDKRRAVLMLLGDEEWRGWSDREIAGRAHVSHTFVAKLREITGNVAAERRYVSKHGTISTMSVGEIGRFGPSRRGSPSDFEMELVRRAGKSCVYFMRSGSLTKIGYSTHLASRLRDLRSHNPGSTLIAVMGGGLADERRLQAQFAERCCEGEWFDLGEDDFDSIGEDARQRGHLYLTLDDVVRNDPAIGRRQADLATIRSLPVEALYQVASEQHRAKQQAKKARREERERALGERIADGNAALAAAAAQGRRYGVIYADPEWRFEPWSRETGMDRAADNHYPTSPVDVIRARPVNAIAAHDSVLFLWATRPMLPQALSVIEAWGFAYKSCTVWGKRREGAARGPGYIFTDESEILLYATRGQVPAPAPGTQWPSLIIAPVGPHSAKPERFHELIEAYFPTLPKIELNARMRRPGWDVWGAEAPEADHFVDATKMVPMGRPVAAELDAYAAEQAIDLPALPRRGRA